MENSRPTSPFAAFVSFESWGNHVSSVCFHGHSGTSSSSSEERGSREADPGASSGTEPAASEGPGEEGESEAPEGEGPAEPGTDSWLIVLFFVFFPSGLPSIRLFWRVCTIILLMPMQRGVRHTSRWGPHWSFVALRGLLRVMMLSASSGPGGLLGGIAVWRCLLGSESRIWTRCGRAYVSWAIGSVVFGCLGRSPFILGFQRLLRYSSLSTLDNPGCFRVSTGQWFENAPNILDLWTRASRPVLALSADLFRYWGRMMWERVGVENRPPFITDLGRFLGAGVRQARRVSVAEGRFLA